MIVEDIKRQFNAVSEVYDRQRRELIPCFDEFYKVSVEISKQVKNPKKILELIILSTMSITETKT